MTTYSKTHSMPLAKLNWTIEGDPVSENYDDVYYSKKNGLEESLYVFFEQNDLPSRWQVDKNFTICELGFGTGLNFLLAVDKWNKHTKNSWLNFISIENEPLSKSDLNKSLSRWDSLSKFKEQLLNKYPLLVPGFHRLLFPEFRTALTLCLGDAKEELQQIEAQVDAWFLDGFSPAKNPEIWEENIYNQMARLSTTNTSFATFTSAGHVRRNLMAVGFNVSKVKGYGGKRECLKGKFCQQSSNRNTKHRNSKPWLAFTNIKKSHPESIAVIGSGIAGTSSARALATRGFNVTLFETEKTIASGASGNPLAILQPYPMAARNQLGIFLEKGFLFAKQLLGEDENLQKNISRHKFGALQLITSDRLKRVSEEFSNLNVIPELTSIVTAEDASKISETKINSAAFFHPLAEAVNPQELCAANITKNVSICYNTEVKCMKREENSWELSLGNGDKKYFHTVIICNSYLAYKFLQLENFKLNQIKGELAFIPQTENSSKLKTIIAHDGYIIPAVSGKHIIGASYERNWDSLDLNEETQNKMLKKTLDNLPELKLTVPQTIAGRVSIRASTYDKLPLVGPVPDYIFYKDQYSLPHKRSSSKDANYFENLYFAIGFGSRGFISAQLAGEYLASLILSEPLPLPWDIVEALHPGRFIIREFKKN